MDLKVETIVPQGTTISLQFYPKSEADAFIKELKDGAISMLRLREKCRGLDRESPLGQIADAAFKHWKMVELLENKVAEASVTMAELRGLVAVLKSQLKDEEERSIRQERCQKYKRCLSKAKAEQFVVDVFKPYMESALRDTIPELWQQRYKRHQRHLERWLALVNYFKEEA